MNSNFVTLDQSTDPVDRELDKQLQDWCSLHFHRNRVPVRVAKTPGRNDPCSCGSGKKYKKCCGINH